MNKYKVGIWEEMSGFIEIKANSQTEAEERADELLCEQGAEELLGHEGIEHRDTSVLSAEEI